MSLNDLSFSDRSGAVFIEAYVCDLSGSKNLLFDGASRGLASSRMDFVLPSRLKGLGLFFLIVFDVEGGAVESAEATDAFDFEGPPTGRLVNDLSTPGSK
jgi:hypothetical protein